MVSGVSVAKGVPRLTAHHRHEAAGTDVIARVRGSHVSARAQTPQRTRAPDGLMRGGYPKLTMRSTRK